jgi:1-acyl-sn-glycerol-3-phosphate acyltransferase
MRVTPNTSSAVANKIRCLPVPAAPPASPGGASLTTAPLTYPAMPDHPLRRPRTTWLTRSFRLARFALHLLWGMAVVATVYPWVSQTTRLRLKQRWSRQLLGTLGVTLETLGDAIPPGAMLVANHISWLDIFVINAARPVAFVSKAEVQSWPLIGWLSAKTDTIFLRRGSRGHAKIINAEIASVLGRGDCAAVFPEGTTTDGSQLLHFHAALLQPAIEAGCPVVPVAVAYYDGGDGRRTVAPAYAGETTMSECLAAIVATPRIVAKLSVAPALATRNGDDTQHRRAIAEAARTSIALSLHLPTAAAPRPASTAPETAAVAAGASPSGDCPTDSPNQGPAA